MDVIGIGNAIVDVLFHTEEAFLEKHSLIKGSMSLINENSADLLYSSMESGVKRSGGSAANTLTGIANLGGEAGFIGRVKNDELGKIFINDISSSGALFETPPANEGPSTARCLIFVTPDAERTMCTFLGASTFLTPNDLDLSLIKKAKVLYLEGYLWDNEEAKKAFLAACKSAKSSNSKVALSLSDSFCVNRHKESFINLVENHIDILFANEEEIKALYKASDFNQAIQNLKGSCEISAITRGEKGSVIIKGDEIIKIDSYKLGPLIDTTGAGDLFASGFLYGYTQGKDLITCGKIGSLCAGQIITTLGSRTEVSLKALINQHIK